MTENRSMEPRRGVRVLVWLGAALAVVSLLVPISWPANDRLFKAAEDAFHFPLFVLIGSAIWLMLTQSRRWRIAGTLAFGLVASVAIELMQSLTGRDPSLSDVFVSLLGVIAGLLWFDSRLWSRAVLKNLERGAAVGLFVFAMWPLPGVLLDRARAEREFPLLSSFEHPAELGRYAVRDIALARVKEHATAGRHAVRATVKRNYKDPYPGLFLSDRMGDWTAYTQLCFDVFIPGPTGLELWMRADDRADNPRYDDRAQVLLPLPEGTNHFCIDLATFLRTPDGRALQRDKMTRWGLFFDHVPPGTQLYLDNVRLQ